MAIASILSNELNALRQVECDWAEPHNKDYLLKCFKVLAWCNASGFPVEERFPYHRELFKEYLGPQLCSLLPPVAPRPDPSWFPTEWPRPEGF